MISRQHRFHGLNSLRPVYKYGQTVHGQQLNLRYRLNEKRRTYRCAVVISKKVEKSAVKRNRIRRQVFETVRRLETRITKPYDLVISVFNSSVTDMPANEFDQKIERLLENAGVIDAVSAK